MKLAIYDFDGTYISTQTVPLLFRVFKSLKLNPKIHKKLWRTITYAYILHKLKLKRSKEAFRTFAMALTIDLLHSINEKERDVLLNDFYKEATLYVNQDLKEALKEDIKDGFHRVLLSGSFDVMLTPFLKDGFDTVIGTKSKNKNTLLNSRNVDIIINEKKLEAIIRHFEHVDLKSSKAIADSYYDLHLLKAVGKPIAYHPDKKLYAYAIKNDMEIVLDAKNSIK
jgi:phosphoserine phosphatase